MTSDVMKADAAQPEAEVQLFDAWLNSIETRICRVCGSSLRS